MKDSASCLLLLLLTACSGATVDVGSFKSGDPGTGTGNPDGLGVDSGTGGGKEGGAPAGPVYEVHLRATQTPVTFTDGYAGQTPLDQRMGVRKLTLLRNANDPSPVVVFDNGSNAVEAGLNDGNDTVCGTAVAATLPAGTFTIAHVTVGYYKYQVAAAMHANGMTVLGDYKDLEVLTDNTIVDGTAYNQGHYSFTFEVGGTAYGTATGENLVFPANTVGGGLSLVTIGREVDVRVHGTNAGERGGI